MIDVYDVLVRFGDTVALDGLSLHVGATTLLGVVGPGGAGKSTLCKVVCGLVRPQRGVVRVNGCDLMQADKRTLQQVQRSMGVQFQNDALFEHRTVGQNVAYPLVRRGVDPAEARQRTVETLAMVGLEGTQDRYPSELSGGQRRRVALARACIARPSILICDDPTAGLDPVTSRQILDMIAGIRYQYEATVILVSSDVVGVMSVATRMALIWSGAVVAEGPVSRFERSDDPRVQRFLDDARLPFASEGVG